MKYTARLYLCARCGLQVLVCSACDRGQRYCGESCRQIVRKQRCLEAQKRYQATLKGRLNHAARQRRYRLKIQSEKNKVTDHRSQPQVDCGELATAVKARPQNSAYRRFICHFCQCSVAELIRQDFLPKGFAKKQQFRKQVYYEDYPKGHR